MKTNRPSYITDDRLYQFIDTAIAEDLGDGDHSTLGSVPSNKQSSAKAIVKTDCIIAGLELAQEIFHFYNPELSVELFKQDGDFVRAGEVVFIVSGSAQSILSMERLVLNCMQRMSGIATYTHEVVELLKDTKTTLLDTRKTSPLFRMCEKWAVTIGGGQNHRFGLYDMVMLKDNHNDFAGGISNAVLATLDYLKTSGKNLKIEVETRNLDEVREALSTEAVDIVMLDNMNFDEMTEAVKLIAGRMKTEASGGITKETIRHIADTGVDYISSGAIIYAAPTIDISLKAICD